MLHLRFFSVFVFFLLAIFFRTLDASERPNVILIMSDDQGYGDFGATGNTAIKTPNIDAMASRSASMKTFYVSPVCSPTRANLMTGRYNFRTRCIDTWLGRSMMEPDEVTVAEVLQEAGYATGIFGKWHLGDCYPMRAIDQGFEEALIHRGGGLAQPSEPRENRRRYTNPVLFRNGKQVLTAGFCTDVYFDAGLEFIEKSQAEGRNFFVYLPTNAPHGPFHDVPEDLRKEYLREKESLLKLLVSKPRDTEAAADKLSRIAAMITNIDDNVGRLFERLDELQLTENTLVIFLVDNGPNGQRYVGDFRGSKSNVHEGGIRSPLWLHWPKRFKPGTARNELSAHIDLMPTILDACNVDVPAQLELDGRSLLPLLENKETQWKERTITIQAHRGDKPVKFHNFMIRDSRWKLLHASGFGRESFSGEPKFELYDLHADPGESNNLSASHSSEVDRLKSAYLDWFNDVSSTRPNNYAPPRIHIGTPHEEVTVLTRQDWRGGTWATRSGGYWLVQVTQPRKYIFDIEFSELSSDAVVMLDVAGITREMKVAKGASSCTISGFEVPAGDCKLEVRISENGKTFGAYQVAVSPSK